ncbi:MAG: acetyl-CoA carboxylase biotin carboxyl carrier protein [Ktedonobacterales bacterium]
MADTERQPLVWRVKALAEAIEGSDVGELDLTEDGMRIFIKRRQEPVVLPAATDVRAPARRATPHRRAHAGGAAPAAGANGAAAPEPGVAVVAPLTGVFYSAPSPNSSSFVQAGDPIQPGQVVCIVEAMKVFNEIKAEVSGTVTAVLPKDGQLVQKGDALIRVKPV